MSTELVDVQAQIAAELATLDNTVSPPSGHRISVKGKVFTLPTGEQSEGPLEAIILDWRSVNMYYTGIYNPSDPKPPACFAIAKNKADLKPSPHCSDPQADSCDEEVCPFNKWGSAPGGGKGKACKNTYRLAVVSADATEKTPVWTLEVSPTGVTGFDNFVTNLKSQYGMLPLQVVVAIAFDTTAAYPKLVFGEFKPHNAIELAFTLREAAKPLLDREPG